MSEQDGSEDWKAPYLAYRTLVNFIDDKLAIGALPPRIDVGFLDSYSGSVRPQLRAALRVIGLIGENDEVLPPLTHAARGAEERNEVLRQWATAFYAEQLDLGRSNATAQMLWESFARHGYTGSTLRKAVVFFLALCEDLDLETSPHFKAPRQAATATRAPRPPRGKVSKAIEPESAPATTVPGETKTVRFGAAGSVEIRVALKWLDLDPDTFVELRKAIDVIESLATPSEELGNQEPELRQ